MSLSVQSDRKPILSGQESSLRVFLENQTPSRALPIRTLAHAWVAAGQSIQVGRMTVRLIATDKQGHPFTAGTLHPGRLELSRVLLQSHGVAEAAWLAWCDEHVELAAHGFDRASNYPAVQLDGASELVVARLALGLRDLAFIVRDQRA
ncbi:MAG: hypothetical protein AABX89_00270 [Candidatus Thermoplasmatota archaeon]